MLERSFEVTSPPGIQPCGLLTSNADVEVSNMPSKFFFHGPVEARDFCPPTFISLSPDAQPRPWVYLQNTLFHSSQCSQLRTVQTLVLLLFGVQLPSLNFFFSFLIVCSDQTMEFMPPPPPNISLKAICPQAPTSFSNATIHNPQPWT